MSAFFSSNGIDIAGSTMSYKEFFALYEVYERDPRELTEEQRRAFDQESQARRAHYARADRGKKIDFSNLKATKIDCSQYDLRVLPEGLDKFTRLREFNCRDNGLTELPAALGRLAHLRVLDCGANQLAALPDEMANLQQLEKLHCNSNHLTRLPAWLGQLPKLQVLYCNDNRLAELPAELGQLGGTLRRLDCENNLLEVLPLELRHLVNLEDTQWCGFTGNPLLSPPLAVAEQGAPAVVAYLGDLFLGGKSMNLPRLMIVGDGGVGKTSTTAAVLRAPGSACADLRDREYESTRGIHMRLWQPPWMASGVVGGGGGNADEAAVDDEGPQKAADAGQENGASEWLDGSLGSGAGKKTARKQNSNKKGNKGKKRSGGGGPKRKNNGGRGASGNGGGGSGGSKSEKNPQAKNTSSAAPRTASPSAAAGHPSSSPGRTGSGASAARVELPLPELKYVRLWDLAGQLEYYVTHALLLGGAATVFVLVVSLTRITRPRGTLEHAELVSLVQQLGMWLRFVRLLSGASYSGHHRRAMAVVVGTHVDKLAEELRAEFGAAGEAPEAAEEGLAMLERELRALPQELVHERLHLDADLENDDAADLHLLDLRPGLPAATARVDRLRARLAEVVALNAELESQHKVPKTYAQLLAVVEEMRREREVEVTKEEPATAPPAGGAAGKQDSAATMASGAQGSFRGFFSRLLGWGDASFSSQPDEATPSTTDGAASTTSILPDDADVSVSYRLVPSAPLKSLWKKSAAIFGDDLAHFGRALRFLESSGLVLVCGRLDEALASAVDGADADPDLAWCTVFLDVQWVSMLASLFLAVPTAEELADGNNPALLPSTEVERRLSGVTKKRPTATETRLIMLAMSQMDLCHFFADRKEYLFPSMLQAVSDGTLLQVMPPSHKVDEGSDARAAVRVARIITFGRDPLLDMVPPGLFSRLQTTLLRIADAPQAAAAVVHMSFIQIAMGETVVWVAEVPSRLQIAVAVAGADTAAVLPQLAALLTKMTELARHFPGMPTPREHACCFACLGGHLFKVKSSGGELPLHFCGADRSAAQSELGNLWDRAFDDARQTKIPCLGRGAGSVPLVQSPCELLTGAPLPTGREELRALKLLVLGHFEWTVPTVVRHNLLCERNVGAVDECVPWDIGPAAVSLSSDANDDQDATLLDVFLSHNGRDKKDMLCVHLTLEVLGFRTFFDLSTIDGVVEEDIVRGLRRSRHLLAWWTESFARSAWACREQWSFLRHRGAEAVTSYAVGINVANEAGGMPRLGPQVDADRMPPPVGARKDGRMPLGYAAMYGRVEKSVRLPLTGGALLTIAARLRDRLGQPAHVAALVSLDRAKWLLVRALGIAEAYEREFGALWNVPAATLHTDVRELRREFSQVAPLGGTDHE